MLVLLALKTHPVPTRSVQVAEQFEFQNKDQVYSIYFDFLAKADFCQGAVPATEIQVLHHETFVPTSNHSKTKSDNFEGAFLDVAYLIALIALIFDCFLVVRNFGPSTGTAAMV